MVRCWATRWRVLLAALALTLTACTDAAKENLDKATKAYNRLEIGMTAADACWNFSVTCDDDTDYRTHFRDFGRTASRDEYIVGMYIRGASLVRVEIIRPRFKGSVRQGTKGDIIAAKGLSRDELQYAHFLTPP